MKNKRYEFLLIIFLSAIIGISVGLTVSLFHVLIDWILVNKSNIINKIYPWQSYRYIAYMFVTSVMVFISVYVVNRYAPDAAGSGIQDIEGVVGDKMEMNSLRIVIVKFFGGLLSLGGSMSMGREGPSVQIGGALGHIVSRFFQFDRRELDVLIAAGAGAGLATAFNAPLAGMLFVFEEMHKEIKYAYVTVKSVATACIVSIITLRMLIGNKILIPMGDIAAPNVYKLWIFCILGILFGVLGFIFNKYLVYFTTKISQISGWKFNILILFIGACIGLLFYIYPDSVGEGYKVIHSALNGNLTLKALLTLFVIRFLTTMISYGTGAPGGIFAPMLALGTLFGISFGIVANELIPSLHLEPLVFAVVGMSALFSSTVRAPIVGIILVAEMTGGFNLLMPLLITSLVAAVVANALGGRAIYTVLLDQSFKVSKFGNIK